MEINALATYKPISEYTPTPGDFLIISKMFGTKYGIVNIYDKKTNELSVIIESTPQLLLTTLPSEMSARTRIINLGDVVSHKGGRYYVMQSNPSKMPVWYV